MRKHSTLQLSTSAATTATFKKLPFIVAFNFWNICCCCCYFFSVFECLFNTAFAYELSAHCSLLSVANDCGKIFMRSIQQKCILIDWILDWWCFMICVFCGILWQRSSSCDLKGNNNNCHTFDMLIICAFIVQFLFHFFLFNNRRQTFYFISPKKSKASL